MASCQRYEISVPSSSQPNKKVCPSMCFLSNKIAEKSYATCDVGKATLRNPSIVSPVHALV